MDLNDIWKDYREENSSFIRDLSLKGQWQIRFFTTR